METFKVQLNSIQDPTSANFETWTIPDDHRQFASQFLEAVNLSNAQKSKLWDSTNYALQKTIENWDYFEPSIRDFWLRTLIHNVRSQLWCQEFDSARANLGESQARKQAVVASESLHRHFHS